jgi:ABC-type multidrug transport system ATPase subunit
MRRDAVASLHGVSKVYPRSVTALAAVDVEILRGSLVALLGPNGSGKSTLLRLVAGRTRPSSGRVTVLGVDPARDPEALLGRLGHVTQEEALDPEMTGAETLALLATLHGLPRPARARSIDELGRRLALEEHLGKRVATYSGGLRRRLHLAAGFLDEPDLLLVDEPTAGLDPGGRAVVWELLAARRDAGRCVVVASHDLASVEARCDQVAILVRGALLAFESPAALCARHARQGTCVLLEAEPVTPDELRASLQRIPGVEAARLDGRRLVLDVAAGIDVEASLGRVMEASRLRISRLEIHRADLESAYLHLTGQPSTGGGEDSPERVTATPVGDRRGSDGSHVTAGGAAR